MAEDTNQNLLNTETQEGTQEAQVEQPKKDPIGDRINNLANKANQAEEEKAQALREKEEAVKERDFYASFSDSVSIHPAAKDYKDQIKEKVMNGYTVEDATVAVLAKEGKLGSVSVETPSRTIGGSASTPPTPSESKTLANMTRDEKRQALMDAEARGDISLS